MASTDCEASLQQLYPYLDGELTPELRRQIADHLVACPPCGDAFGFEVELKKVVSDRSVERVPDELRQKIASLLAE